MPKLKDAAHTLLGAMIVASCVAAAVWAARAAWGFLASPGGMFEAGRITGQAAVFGLIALAIIGVLVMVIKVTEHLSRHDVLDESADDHMRKTKVIIRNMLRTTRDCDGL